uniref:Uncharacterized protein n=1 Tax=Glossina pallidipes TaxID=7398 RepID=A0A1A9Z535_GLOPL
MDMVATTQTAHEYQTVHCRVISLSMPHMLSLSNLLDFEVEKSAAKTARIVRTSDMSSSYSKSKSNEFYIQNSHFSFKFKFLFPNCLMHSYIIDRSLSMLEKVSPYSRIIYSVNK